TVEGVRYGSIEATLEHPVGSSPAQRANIWLTFAMREGKNREIRKVLGALGLQVNRLIRVSFGPFQLGDPPPGEVMEVSTRKLRDQVGERLAAISGADFSAPIVNVIPPLEGRASERREPGRGDNTNPTRPPPAATLPQRGREKEFQSSHRQKR